LIDAYDWAGGREAMLRFGPVRGSVVVAALPLAERGVAGALPDLPGQGESLRATEAAQLAELRAAFAAAVSHAGSPAYALGIRSGALLDATATLTGRWHFAPQAGADLARELERIRRAGEGADHGGNRIAPSLLSDLAEAGIAAKARTVRLESDSAPAERKLAGSPLWRRAEPGNDPRLAGLLADDIALWVRSCEG
jgi:hypothetical protein